MLDYFTPTFNHNTF